MATFETPQQGPRRPPQTMMRSPEGMAAQRTLDRLKKVVKQRADPGLLRLSLQAIEQLSAERDAAQAEVATLKGRLSHQASHYAPGREEDFSPTRRTADLGNLSLLGTRSPAQPVRRKLTFPSPGPDHGALLKAQAQLAETRARLAEQEAESVREALDRSGRELDSMQDELNQLRERVLASPSHPQVSPPKPRRTHKRLTPENARALLEAIATYDPPLPPRADKRIVKTLEKILNGDPRATLSTRDSKHLFAALAQSMNEDSGIESSEDERPRRSAPRSRRRARKPRSQREAASIEKASQLSRLRRSGDFSSLRGRASSRTPSRRRHPRADLTRFNHCGECSRIFWDTVKADPRINRILHKKGIDAAFAALSQRPGGIDHLHHLRRG